MLKMSRLWLLAASLLTSGLSAAASPQSEGFRRLSAPQIVQAFTGKTFSDDTHFSFRYRPKGLIEGMSMGRKVENKWRVEKDLLCETSRTGESCYSVWKKGQAVKLVVDGTEVIVDGFLR
jgi:hypothetical protein